jgi:hypothetical protein
MTAPLPPPTVTKIEFLDTPVGYERANVRYWNEAAVKLAVREALERIVKKARANDWIEPTCDGSIVTFPLADIEAMLKEYE